MKFDVFQEQIFFATVRIEKPIKNSMGTGFLVRIPSRKEGQEYVFLVSNKHVLTDPKDEVRMIFHKKNDIENIPELEENIPLAINEIADGAYYAHPDPNIDLACLNLSSIFNLGIKIYHRTLRLDLFADFTEYDLQAGNEVVFVGYPENRYDQVHNLPILRGGRIASLPKIDFEKKPFFLIDAQVFGGSSGSPVFTILNKKYRFIGVVCATMIKQQELQITEALAASVVNQIIGIGLVLKAAHVKELLSYAVNKLDKLIYEI